MIYYKTIPKTKVIKSAEMKLNVKYDIGKQTIEKKSIGFNERKITKMVRDKRCNVLK